MKRLHETADLVRAVACPVCAHHVAVSLFDGDVDGAGIDAVRCVDCGHVFNVAAIPTAGEHAGQPSRTFSSAPGWREHVRALRDETLARLPASPVVIEVGYGDAEFLAALAEARPAGRYVGFDPHGVAETPHAKVELRRERFVATRALAEITPDLVIARYVWTVSARSRPEQASASPAPHITGPMIQGANSSSPTPESSLFDGLPDATAMISSKI